MPTSAKSFHSVQTAHHFTLFILLSIHPAKRQPWRPYHLHTNLFPVVPTAVYASVVSACRTRLFVSGRLLRRDCACPVSHEQTSKSSSQTFKLDRTIQWEKSSASNHCPFCPALGIVFEPSFSPMQYRLAFKVQIHPVTLSSLTTSSAPPVFNLGGTVKKAPPAMAERRQDVRVKKLKAGEQGQSSGDTEGTMSLYDRTP